MLVKEHVLPSILSLPVVECLEPNAVNRNLKELRQKILVIVNNFLRQRKFQSSFSLMRKIGEGAFGEVFMVKERTTDDLFAIKKIRIQSK